MVTNYTGEININGALKTTTAILTVPYVAIEAGNVRQDILRDLFSQVKAHNLDYEPWPGNNTRPEIGFKAIYSDTAIFLKFKVNEKYYRAQHQQINCPVFEDSCVEFFIGFGDNGPYYNFEFNAIGTTLVGYGTGRDRELLDAALIKGIKTWAISNISDNELLPFHWELMLSIPFNVFSKHNITSVKGLTCRGNFFKCGDKLPEPHFLCWNNVTAAEPNFHLPQYFGKIVFE